MTLLIIYLLLAIGISFLCSVLEAVLLSVNTPYVAALKSEGKESGNRLQALKEDIDRPLSAILSFNTIAHTAGAAGVGAQATAIWGDAVLGIASALMTVAILIFSEIIPKTLGATHWRSLAPLVSRVLGPLIILMWPLVQLSRGISAIIGKKGLSPVSREEVSAMAELGAQQGVFADGESRILRSVFHFETIAVEHIMTPRTVVFSLSASEKVGDIVDLIAKSPFSRIPITGESIDDVVGYVLRDDILLHVAKDKFDTDLRQLKRTIKVVAKDWHLPKLFEEMLDEREHIALVVDKFGGTAGIVTVEDILETLIGMEIVDEADHVDDMQALARKNWEHRARKRGLLSD